MINITDIFDNNAMARLVSLWLADDNDETDLVGAAEYAAEMRVPAVSVMPRDVKTVWPWLEKINIKIIPRFYVDNVSENTISGLVMDVNSVLKQGADGAQLIVKLNNMDKFADSIVSVRDDLFFNKDLSIGLDMFEIWPLDWPDVFANLKKISASSLLLILSHDDMEKSDFIGRIYAALDAWDANSNMELHVMFGESHNRPEQVYRLVEKMRPDLLDKLKFFVSY